MDEEPDNDTLEQWQKDPDNWVLGMFYFNNKDKRIFPPKRIAMLGWTINFANPYSVLIFMVFFIFIIMVIVITK